MLLSWSQYKAANLSGCSTLFFSIHLGVSYLDGEGARDYLYANEYLQSRCIYIRATTLIYLHKYDSCYAKTGKVVCQLLLMPNEDIDPDSNRPGTVRRVLDAGEASFLRPIMLPP